MQFSVNHPIIFVIVGVIILLVVGQSVFFLVRALKRAKEIGISNERIKRIVISSALFTIAPAVSILVGVIALSKTLGVPLPWLRLSVIGSLSYETVAAGNAITAFGAEMGEQITSPSMYVTVCFVMTIGILIGLILVPLLTKKIQHGMIKLDSMDKKWSEIFTNAMFLGMISAFLGYVFCDVTNLFRSSEYLASQGVTRTACLIPVCVMLAAAVVMAALGLSAKKFKLRWMEDYALPISLIAGMASAIPFTMWLG